MSEHPRTCPLCRERKGKRACPAKGESICAPCCGSKRRVEIDCPADCAYLTGAHAPAWPGRETERKRDLRRLGPHLSGLDDKQIRLFFLTLLALKRLRARRHELTDALLLAALSALRKTVETRLRGVIYEHAPEDPRAVSLVADLEALYRSAADDGRPVTPGDHDLFTVLQAFENGLKDTAREGQGATAFLDTVSRLAAGAQAEEARRGDAEAPRILTP